MKPCSASLSPTATEETLAGKTIVVTAGEDRPDGWASGVYERGGSTNVPNINTAAVVLEAALFERLGRPLLKKEL